jgi:hypothetical protein
MDGDFTVAVDVFVLWNYSDEVQYNIDHVDKKTVESDRFFEVTDFVGSEGQLKRDLIRKVQYNCRLGSR